jgi:hypothetical protein
MAGTSRPLLVGTWAAATWAVSFYQRHGFTLTDPAQTKRLLREYWDVPPRQMDVSVVLARREIPARHCAGARDPNQAA